MNIPKTLYHISDIHDPVVNFFTPRIPKRLLDEEDVEFERICTSESIFGCIEGHGQSAWYLHACYEWEYFEPYDHTHVISVLIDHENVTGYLLRVYEFDTREDDVIWDFNELIHRGLVPDAHKSREHWIMNDRKPDRTSYILVTKAEPIGENYVYEYQSFTKETLGRHTFPTLAK